MKTKLVGLMLILVAGGSVAAGTDDLANILDAAAKQRHDGNLRVAIELLETARAAAGPACPPRLTGELGATYFQAHRLQEAEALLIEAHTRAADPAERALFANDLGNLSASRGRAEEAVR